VTNAAVCIAAVSYLSVFAPGISSIPALPAAAAVAFVWTLTAVNALSIRAVGNFQIVTTILKLMPLAAAIVIGLVVVSSGGSTAEPFRTSEISAAAITATASLTLWTMLGFESATVPAGRVRDPERTIPRATLWGTLLVGIVYLLASTSVSFILPAAEAAKSNAPFADAVRPYLGSGAAMLIALFAAISCIGALNGWVLLQGEMPLAMARNGVFPRWFARVSKAGTPVLGQILSSTLATILILSNYSRSMGQLFTFMALLATVATLVLYVMCALAALRLMSRGDIPRTAALTATGFIGVIYGLWTFYGAGAEAVAWGAALLASGIPVYVIMRRTGSSRAPAPAPAAPRE
jgi:APA family basic amino acid/polyamine antiporter